MPTKGTVTPTTITYRPGLNADIYVPASPTGAVCLIAHVGGFTSTSASKTDTACVDLAHGLNAIGIIAISYDYTPATGAGLANGQWPRAVLDTLQIMRWTYWNIRAYGGDPARVAAVGLSAGADLAVFAALATRSGTYVMPNGTSLVETGAPFAQLANETNLIARSGGWYGLYNFQPYAISSVNTNPSNLLTLFQCSSSSDPNYAPRAFDASAINLPHTGAGYIQWGVAGSNDLTIDPIHTTNMWPTKSTIATGGVHVFDPTAGGIYLASNLTMWGGGIGSLLGGL